MGKIVFNIEGNQFNDNSSVIKNLKDSDESSQLKEILNELSSIKAQLDPSDELYEAVTDLRNAIETHHESKIKQVIREYAKAFTMPLFANLASASLMQYILTV